MRRFALSWPFACAVMVAVALFCQFRCPILDGDTFWQMAYGRYLLENHTLVPDHGAFTWSVTDTTPIYCAPFSEILLYLSYKMGGYLAHAVLVYACMATLVAVVLWYSIKWRVAKNPVTWLACLLGVLISLYAGSPKPQIFSYVFLCLSAAIWMDMKHAGEKAWKRCYAFPILMLVWINTHGGFIIGLAFWAAVCAGEAANAWLSPKAALPGRAVRHLAFSLVLAAAAVLATPYGWKYPAFLAKGLLFMDNARHFARVDAYGSIFTRDPKLHFVQYLIICLVVLAVLAVPRIRSRSFDWAIAMANALMLFLFVKYVRTTFYWAPVFCLTVAHWLSLRPGFFWPVAPKFQKARDILVLCACLFLGGRAAHGFIVYPGPYYWFGHGISYVNPVEEGGYIARYLPPCRVGNDYNTGGYLLWRLAPRSKVFVDSRYFPFRQWAGAYEDFASGKNVAAFVEKNRADAWCLGLGLGKTLNWFLASKDWELAFYGPSAAVFVKSGCELLPGAPKSGKGLEDIKAVSSALEALAFALKIKDGTNAGVILSGMEKRFDKTPDQRRMVAASERWVAGTHAYWNNRYEEASALLNEARMSGLQLDPGLVFSALSWAASQNWNKNKIRRAADEASLAFKLYPRNVLASYNAGVVFWAMAAQEGSPSLEERGKKLLRLFLTATSDKQDAYQRPRQTAQNILEGRQKERPLLLVPTPGEEEGRIS